VTTGTIPLRRGEPALRRGRSWMKRLQPVAVPREQKSAAASTPKPRRTPRHPAPPAASAPHRFVHEVRRFASGWWGYHSQRHRKWDYSVASATEDQGCLLGPPGRLELRPRT
jgi:hypothetical protein